MLKMLSRNIIEAFRSFDDGSAHGLDALARRMGVSVGRASSFLEELESRGAAVWFRDNNTWSWIQGGRQWFGGGGSCSFAPLPIVPGAISRTVSIEEKMCKLSSAIERGVISGVAENSSGPVVVVPPGASDDAGERLVDVVEEMSSLSNMLISHSKFRVEWRDAAYEASDDIAKTFAASEMPSVYRTYVGNMSSEDLVGEVVYQFVLFTAASALSFGSLPEVFVDSICLGPVPFGWCGDAISYPCSGRLACGVKTG